MRYFIMLAMLVPFVLNPGDANAQQANFLKNLEGTWETPNSNNPRMGDGRWDLSIKGAEIELVQTSYYGPLTASVSGWRPIQDGALSFFGTVDGLTFSGKCTIDWSHNYRNGQVFTRRFKGTISADGRRMHLEYTVVGPAGSNRDGTANFMEAERTIDLVQR